MEREILIKTENLCKTFQTEHGEQRLITDLNIEIYKGDFTVIMGASGSGKSTLLYNLSGLDRPTSGTILFSGNNVTEMTTDQMADFRKRYCGFIFQQHCLIDSLNVLDNVIMAGMLVSGDKKEIIAKAKALFRQLEIPEATEKKHPNQISGGRAQRVAIVRALINSPDVIFADEPTGSLNSKASKEVLDIFTDVNRNGQSLIMVTHSVVSACRGSRILYLRDGNILDECNLGAYDGNDDARIGKLNLFLQKMGW